MLFNQQWFLFVSLVNRTILTKLNSKLSSPIEIRNSFIVSVVRPLKNKGVISLYLTLNIPYRRLFYVVYISVIKVTYYTKFLKNTENWLMNILGCEKTYWMAIRYLFWHPSNSLIVHKTSWKIDFGIFVPFCCNVTMKHLSYYF